MRERLYKLTIGLAILFAVDCLFMAWARKMGGYAGLGYAQFVFFPIFVPAFLAAIVITGIYIHGFVRQSWTARRAEKIFFFVFATAVAAKIVVWVIGEK
jgi:hypothetical protein